MKKFIYWLMGEKAGRVTIATWNWLWGIPAESGGQISVAVAEESLKTMQESVQKLAGAVATQLSAYKKLKQQYDTKVKEKRMLEQEALIAENSGDEDSARIALLKAIQIEQVLPQFEAQLKQAQDLVNASQTMLYQEQVKLETYKTDIHNMKAMAEINEALAVISQANNDIAGVTAKSQFEQVKSAVEQRYLEQQALAEISGNSSANLGNKFNQIDLDNEVNQRLAQLKNKSTSSKNGDSREGRSTRKRTSKN